MSPPLAMAHELTPELNPFVSDIGDRLMRSFRAVPVDADRLALLEKVLAFAANAEQQLPEQQQRIAQLEWMSQTDEFTGLPKSIRQGEVMFEAPRKVTVKDGTMKDWFAPYDVHVYKFKE